jgi:hypothetical protein
MRLSNIPVGHVAKSLNGSPIVLVGLNCGMYINKSADPFSYPKDESNDDYEDLGPLNVEVIEKEVIKKLKLALVNILIIFFWGS